MKHRIDRRVAVLDRFPFTIPYQIIGDEIVVLALAHISRRPGYWSRRWYGFASLASVTYLNRSTTCDPDGIRTRDEAPNFLNCLDALQASSLVTSPPDPARSRRNPLAPVRRGEFRHEVSGARTCSRHS